MMSVSGSECGPVPCPPTAFLWCPRAGWAARGCDALCGPTESHLRLPGHRGKWEQRKVPAPILHPGHQTGKPAVVHGQPTGEGACVCEGQRMNGCVYMIDSFSHVSDFIEIILWLVRTENIWTNWAPLCLVVLKSDCLGALFWSSDACLVLTVRYSDAFPSFQAAIINFSSQWKWTSRDLQLQGVLGENACFSCLYFFSKVRSFSGMLNVCLKTRMDENETGSCGFVGQNYTWHIF